MELHFLNLTKLPNTKPIGTEVSQMTELEKWLLFIQTTEKEIREKD